MNKYYDSLIVLAEPVRLKILLLISEAGEMISKDIQAKFDITQPTMSHHMNVLCESGLVKSRKSGRCVYYSVNNKSIDGIIGLLNSIKSGEAVEVPEKPVKEKKAKVQEVPEKPVEDTSKKKKKSGKKKDKEKEKDKDKDKSKKKKKK